MSFVTDIVHPLIKQICKITHFGKSLSDNYDLHRCSRHEALLWTWSDHL